MTRYQSWGCYPPLQQQEIHRLLWSCDSAPFYSWGKKILPRGHGRSYGDSCLNEGGILLDTTSLNRFLAFDSQRGILRCEAGVSLQEIIHVFAPQGWFLPVTPGTQFITIGGAIANDVHGKNHHKAGSFGCHVQGLELLRSDGTRTFCSSSVRSDLFQATVGGLGLTGLILWADIQLKRIQSPWILAERIKFSYLRDFFVLSSESETAYEYTVAWIDCFAPPHALGRGIFIRGNHEESASPFSGRKSRKSIRIPFAMPSTFLNSTTLKLFNAFHYHFSPNYKPMHKESFDQFFYPLDAILEWNRLYGSLGFLQYQCVIPPDNQEEGIQRILRNIRQSGQGSFLGVLKQFGNRPSSGLLSFPRPGTTLALDFPFRGVKTLTLLDSLDEIVSDCGGAVYPAKDARMSAKSFQQYFPRWKDFLHFIDPKFSSSFWRRVTPSSDHKSWSEQNQTTTVAFSSTAQPSLFLQ